MTKRDSRGLQQAKIPNKGGDMVFIAIGGRLFILIVLSSVIFVAAPKIHAEQVFKCEIDGEVVFSDTGCVGKRESQHVIESPNRSAPIEIPSKTPVPPERPSSTDKPRTTYDLASGSKGATYDREARRAECMELNQNAELASTRQALSALCTEPMDDSTFRDCVERIHDAELASEKYAISRICVGADNEALDHPGKITCDDHRCRDTLGRNYRKVGNQLMRFDGKRCTIRGRSVICPNE